jgi:membrane protein implicated in regulation of membrane protease activity
MPDIVSTAKFIGGAIVFLLWIGVLSFAAAFALSLRAGLILLGVLPLAAVATLLLHEGLRGALREARLFLRVSRGSGVMRQLRERQRELGRRLDESWVRNQSEAT